jgi:hypothetical protein
MILTILILTNTITAISLVVYYKKYKKLYWENIGWGAK